MGREEKGTSSMEAPGILKEVSHFIDYKAGVERLALYDYIWGLWISDGYDF